MLRRAALALLLALSACLPTPSSGDGLVARTRVLADDDPHRTRVGDAEVLGILHLDWAGERWFGGFSGMVMEGDRVTAVNDAGHWLAFTLRTDAAGRPLGVADGHLTHLAGLDGSKDDGDAEEVTATPEGLVVAFERRHRLLLYPAGLSAAPRRLDGPAGFRDLPRNGGAEAVVRLPDGLLLAIAEQGGEGASLAWLGRPGAWQNLSYRRIGDFHPSGAALLPDGDVLVLERSFSLFGGMAIRLVRVAAGAIRPGAVLEGREVFRLQPPLLVDNYEAVAVKTRVSDGRLVAYLLADDNFNPLQATLLMAVLLP